MRRALAACVAASALVACGCGCAVGDRANAISVQVRVTTRDPGSNEPTERRYTLGCKPTSGTLPFAARLCADVARHPVSMLAPGRARSVCGGRAFGPVVEVQSVWNGRTRSFSGGPGCGWPGGTALAVYWAAANRDTKSLSAFEPRLRCDDDRTLLAIPPRWASIAACMHGLWTPRAERLIRLAGHLSQLAGLDARSLFPHEVGARRCAIQTGGPRRRTIYGLCGVTVKNAWSTPEVTFTEKWTWIGTHQPKRHRWRVSILNGIPHLAGQTGPIPPQLWR
jgi:hypothetical protein